MAKISAIQKQIEEDDGVPGARARKNAQRASDANPVKVDPEADDSNDAFESDSLFKGLFKGSE